MDAEAKRLMQVKAGLVLMTSTPGWTFYKQMAKNLIERTTNDAFDENDATKRDSKVLKASALRTGLNELFNAVETTKQIVESEDGGISLDFSDEQSTQIQEQEAE